MRGSADNAGLGLSRALSVVSELDTRKNLSGCPTSYVTYEFDSALFSF